MGREDDKRAHNPCRGQTLLWGLHVDQPVSPSTSLRSQESVRPHTHGSVSTSAVSSPSSLRSLKIKGCCCIFPPTLPSFPNREVLKAVRMSQWLWAQEGTCLTAWGRGDLAEE